MPSIECPKCEARQFVALEGIGQRAECSFCQAIFPAVAIEDFVEPVDPKGIVRFLAGIYEPIDGDERRWLMTEAAWRVKKPGNGLMVTGLFGMVATIIIGLFALVNLMDKIQRGFNNNRDDIIRGLAITIGASFYCFLLIAGGRQLKRLEHRGFCFFVAVLAILSVIPCGGWLILSIPAVIFGTWTLAALQHPVVKHAMRWKREDREQSRMM